MLELKEFLRVLDFLVEVGSYFILPCWDGFSGNFEFRTTHFGVEIVKEFVPFEFIVTSFSLSFSLPAISDVLEAASPIPIEGV